MTTEIQPSTQLVNFGESETSEFSLTMIKVVTSSAEELSRVVSGDLAFSSGNPTTWTSNYSQSAALQAKERPEYICHIEKKPGKGLVKG